MPSSPPDPKKIVARLKTAGEVRFIKDRGNDHKEWAWNPPGASERKISENFVFNAKHLKPLVMTLRSLLMALGHATSAHARFVKIKSRNVSPDGAFGGQGYVQKIPDMRKNLMNVVEALSAMTDTIHDEVNAPHWDPAEDKLTPRDRDEVKQLVKETDTIQQDPEGWAEEVEEESVEVDEDDDGDPRSKKASSNIMDVLFRTSRVASAGLNHEDRLAVHQHFGSIAKIVSRSSNS